MPVEVELAVDPRLQAYSDGDGAPMDDAVKENWESMLGRRVWGGVIRRLRLWDESERPRKDEEHVSRGRLNSLRRGRFHEGGGVIWPKAAAAVRSPFGRKRRRKTVC